MEFSRLFGTVCIYGQTQTRNYILQGNADDCKRTATSSQRYAPLTSIVVRRLQGSVAYSYVRICWRNSRTWHDQTWRVTHAIQHTPTQQVWHNTPAAGSFLCHLLRSNHSHWAVPYAVMQTPPVLSQTIVPGHLKTCPEVSSWSVVRPLAVGASLVALGWTTMTAVVMVIINATKITDCQTLQTEGRLKYSQFQVPKCVDVCQIHIILL